MKDYGAGIVLEDYSDERLRPDFLLRNREMERQETKGCQDGEQKKGITCFATPCIIYLSHYIEKKSYLLYFIATILAHSVPSMAALTIPPAYPAPSPAG